MKTSNQSSIAVFRMVLLICALAGRMAYGLEPEVLYSFPVSSQNPYAGLILGSDGYLYGTTRIGGVSGYGTVFRMDTNGVLTTLVSFASTNGAYPEAGLVEGKDGNFYGTTSHGGAVGYGTVFRMDTNGVWTTLVSFASTNGGFPEAGLVQGSDGSFYGTTESGGATGKGTVFRVDANGALTTLVSFASTNGANPYAGLVQGRDGNLYGTTYTGGAYSDSYGQGYGTVFRVGTNGGLATLISFASTNGAAPYSSLVQGADGYLYGTTESGGAYTNSLGHGYGTVFRMDTNGALTTLLSFAYTNGASPYGGLMQTGDGKFYGMTSAGGAYTNYISQGYGTVFRVTTNGALTTLASFAGTNGGYSRTVLVQGSDGNFYGTTPGGDGNAYYGTAFRMDAAGTVTTLVFFNDYGPGQGPSGDLVQADDGYFYGTASGGGGENGGTVFRISTNGALTPLVFFASGANPRAGLVEGQDGNFYGTTENGGAGHYGTVFRMDTNGALTTLVTFASTNGANPFAALVQGSAGSFYGTTFGGGAGSRGTVFRTDTNGALATMVSFASTNGAYPQAGLVQGGDGNFYGTTGNGGASGKGTVFRTDTNGALTTLISFGSTNGANPYAALVQARDGYFYGTTSSGGTSNLGTVFRMDPNGDLTTLVSFASTNGANPRAGLVQGSNGYFYGTTYSGGSNSFGTVFQMDTRGVLTTLVSFASTNGANPGAGLVQGSDGFLYGITYAGGREGGGTVFRIAEPQPPSIVTQPQPRTNAAGSSVSFSVSAAGTDPLSYWWRKNAANLSDNARVSGTATPMLTITGVVPSDLGGYSVVVSNLAGSTNSAVAMLTVTIPPQGVRSNVLTAFADTGSGPMNPKGRLLQAADGTLYGTSYSGGAYGLPEGGTVFQLNTNGALLNVISFDGTNGASPYAGLTTGADGNFYGTTFTGGSNDSGTVFELSTNGTLTSLGSLGDSGAYPYARVVQGSDGNLYGTASSGGPDGDGAVFVVTSGGIQPPLTAFDGTNSAAPQGALLPAGESSFYGTTAGSELVGPGTIFSLTTNGDLTTLFSFGVTNGQSPQAGLIAGPSGSLYGTTYGGGDGGYGTVFQFTSGGALKTLLSFAGTNGANPVAELLAGGDGGLYGTTRNGGAYGEGTVFQLTPQGELKLLLSFDGTNGAYPDAALIQGTDGGLYGTAVYGGPGGAGTVYRISFDPWIVTPPAGVQVFAGSAVALSVAARGTGPLVYQWEYNGTNLTDGGNISGALSPTLTITNITTAQAGLYSVLVADPAGSVTSLPAAVSVITPGVLLIDRLPDSNVQISFLGYSNYSSAINVSTDLLNWSALMNFPPTNGPLQFPDLVATNYPQRFYRGVWTP